MALRKLKVLKEEKPDATSSPRLRRFRLLRRNLRKEGFSWEPIAILPPEIATMCLQYALPSIDSGDYPLRLLDLATVSQRWETFLFSIPSFWTTIHVKYKNHDLLATIALFAHLSGRAALTLVVCNDVGSEWDIVKSLLSSHAHRISRVTLPVDTPIYEDSPFSDAGHISLVTSIVKSFGHLSLAEVDFGRRLELKSSQLKELDLPADVRVTSSIICSLDDAPSWGLFLTPSVHAGPPINRESIVLPHFVRKRALEPIAIDDLTISLLNSNISSVIDIFKLLDSSSNSVANPLFEPFISANTCLLCGWKKQSLVMALACIRSHFGLPPFRCSGCRLCNGANGYASFSTLYLLDDHIGATCASATCGNRTAGHWKTSEGKPNCVTCLIKKEGKNRVSIASLCN